VNVSLVPGDHIDAVWDSVKDFLTPAVKVTNGRYMLYDVYAAIKAERMQLWIAFNDEREVLGCEVTSITDYPSRRVLTSVFTGGRKINLWKNEMMGILVQWAEDNQCTAIEGYGRKGWIRMLDAYGVKQSLILFEKDI
jgi:effector-binding domain-containing protein